MMKMFSSGPSFLARDVRSRYAAARTASIGVVLLLSLSLDASIACSPAAANTGSSPLRLAEAASPEVTFWESVRDSKDPAEIEAYLKAYPDGQFAPLARIRLDKLKQPAREAPSDQSPAAPQPGKAEGSDELGRKSLTAKIGESPGSKRGILGARVTGLTAELASAFGLASANGAFVTEVLPNMAAAQAGFKPLDVVVEFGGNEIRRWAQLPEMAGSTPPGTEVSLVFWRFARSFQELADSLRARAEKGDARAANALGWLYAIPSEVKNDQEAVRWLRKAADQGHAEAMTRLAQMYANGQGLNKDEAEAARWYRKAADQNYSDAILSLGVLYEGGRGVPRDEAEAARLYRKAAGQGNANAMHNLGLLYAAGRGVPQDDAQAVDWYRKAADEGVAVSISNLAFMYEVGRGVAKDEAQAFSFYQKAANLNQGGAMTRLGNMYLDGRGVAKDDAIALGWYRRAAEKNHAGAMNRLGFMYTNGRGTAIDLVQAAAWYRKGAELAHSEAMYGMANAYDHGLGVTKDASAAADWMLKAVKAHSDRAVKEMTTNSQSWSEEFRRQLQQRMHDAGVYNGPLDGSFGPATASAIEALSKQPKQ